MTAMEASTGVVDEARQAGAGAKRRTPLARRFAGRVLLLARRNRLFTVLLLGGVALRVVVMVAYSPALYYANDSFSYMEVARHPWPYVLRPSGYPLIILRPLQLLPDPAFFVALLQHLLGLATAVLLYALLKRLGVPSWLAVLATLQPLYDAYQVQLEHLIMSDELFAFLIVVAVVLVLWWQRPPLWACLVLGAVLCAATATRTIGLPVAVVLLAALLVRRPGAKQWVAAAAMTAVPLLAYAAWFHSYHGTYALESSDGAFLYGRVAPWVNCAKFSVPASERVLCKLPANAHTDAGYFVWTPNTPLLKLPGPGNIFTPSKEALARDFAIRAIKAQPGAYTKAVWGDVRRTMSSNERPSIEYLFSLAPPAAPCNVQTRLAQISCQAVKRYGAPRATSIASGPAHFLMSYQRRVGVHWRGPWTAAALVIAVLGLAAGRDPERRVRFAVMVIVCTAAVLLVVPPITVQYDLRYVVPALPFVCAAGALGLTLLWPRTARIREWLSKRRRPDAYNQGLS